MTTGKMVFSVGGSHQSFELADRRTAPAGSARAFGIGAPKRKRPRSQRNRSVWTALQISPASMGAGWTTGPLHFQYSATGRGGVELSQIYANIRPSARSFNRSRPGAWGQPYGVRKL